MRGLSVILENLFHLRLKFTELSKNESWTELTDDIYRVEVLDDDNSLVGIVYLGISFSFHQILNINCND